MNLRWVHRLHGFVACDDTVGTVDVKALSAMRSSPGPLSTYALLAVMVKA